MSKQYSPTGTMDLRNTAFLKSATNLAQCPPDTGIEVAFIGRSNSGKSSALNTITGRDGLAKTSKMPGHTQHINIFELDPQRRLIDLPGYGFAKIPEQKRREIERMMSAYLFERQCCAGLFVMMDIRHPLSTPDMEFIDLVYPLEIKVHILLTKCDKLSRNQANQRLMEVKQRLSNLPTSQFSVQTFSSLKHIGTDIARAKLAEWFSFEE